MATPYDPAAGTALDKTVPHSARVWNYWLGGKDNYEVDRIAGDQYAQLDPSITTIARETRAFLRRVVTYLTREAGVRQFLDVGTGLPTVSNTHEIAQAVAPDARVVYVDNDPLVLAHARALLTSTSEGSTRYIDADMNDADTLLQRASQTLDLQRPVALLLMGVLGHVSSLDNARSLTQLLMSHLPSGSYLAMCDGTPNPGAEAAAKAYAAAGAVPYILRPPADLATIFTGLEWVEPGFGMITHWRPDVTLPDGIPTIGSPEPIAVDEYGGVARKL